MCQNYLLRRKAANVVQELKIQMTGRELNNNNHNYYEIRPLRKMVDIISDQRPWDKTFIPLNRDKEKPDTEFSVCTKNKQIQTNHLLPGEEKSRRNS